MTEEPSFVAIESEAEDLAVVAIKSTAEELAEVEAELAALGPAPFRTVYMGRAGAGFALLTLATATLLPAVVSVALLMNEPLWLVSQGAWARVAVVAAGVAMGALGGGVVGFVLMVYAGIRRSSTESWLWIKMDLEERRRTLKAEISEAADHPPIAR